MNKIFSLYSITDVIRLWPWHLNSPTTSPKVVLACGCFDLLHIGHIRHLQEAKALGNTLVVVVTRDKYVNKGPDRPMFSANMRAEAVAGLACVDFVAINPCPTAVEAINLIRPSVYCKGHEYEDNITIALQQEKQAVEAIGGKLVFIGEKIASSSELMERVLQCS